MTKGFRKLSNKSKMDKPPCAMCGGDPCGCGPNGGDPMGGDCCEELIAVLEGLGPLTIDPAQLAAFCEKLFAKDPAIPVQVCNTVAVTFDGVLQAEITNLAELAALLAAELSAIFDTPIEVVITNGGVIEVTFDPALIDFSAVIDALNDLTVTIGNLPLEITGAVTIDGHVHAEIDNFAELVALLAGLEVVVSGAVDATITNTKDNPIPTEVCNFEDMILGIEAGVVTIGCTCDDDEERTGTVILCKIVDEKTGAQSWEIKWLGVASAAVIDYDPAVHGPTKDCVDKQGVPQCVKWSSVVHFLDNTFTKFDESHTFELTLSDGTTKTVSVDPTTDYTAQLNEWQAKFAACLPNCTVEARCNTPAGCGGLLPPPSNAIPSGNIFARYLSLVCCPTDASITQVQIIASSNPKRVGKVLVLEVRKTPEQRGWICAECGEVPILYDENWQPVPAADLPACWFECDEQIPSPSDTNCTYTTVTGCDLGTEPPTDIIRVYTECDGAITFADFVEDDGALEDYTIVGEFDIKTGTPPKELCTIDDAVVICPDVVTDCEIVKVETQNSSGFANKIPTNGISGANHTYIVDKPSGVGITFYDRCRLTGSFIHGEHFDQDGNTLTTALAFDNIISYVKVPDPADPNGVPLSIEIETGPPLKDCNGQLLAMWNSHTTGKLEPSLTNSINCALSCFQLRETIEDVKAVYTKQVEPFDVNVLNDVLQSVLTECGGDLADADYDGAIQITTGRPLNNVPWQLIDNRDSSNQVVVVSGATFAEFVANAESMGFTNFIVDGQAHYFCPCPAGLVNAGDYFVTADGNTVTKPVCTPLAKLQNAPTKTQPESKPALQTLGCLDDEILAKLCLIADKPSDLPLTPCQTCTVIPYEAGTIIDSPIIEIVGGTGQPQPIPNGPFSTIQTFAAALAMQGYSVDVVGNTIEVCGGTEPIIGYVLEDGTIINATSYMQRDGLLVCDPNSSAMLAALETLIGGQQTNNELLAELLDCLCDCSPDSCSAPISVKDEDGNDFTPIGDAGPDANFPSPAANDTAILAPAYSVQAAYPECAAGSVRLKLTWDHETDGGVYGGAGGGHDGFVVLPPVGASWVAGSETNGIQNNGSTITVGQRDNTAPWTLDRRVRCVELDVPIATLQAGFNLTFSAFGSVGSGGEILHDFTVTASTAQPNLDCSGCEEKEDGGGKRDG